MKTLFLLGIIALAGCREIRLDETVQTTGPVKIVTSVFDYHETLEKPDGQEFEFNHCEIEGVLFDEGATVNITYKGDSNELIEPNCAKIIGVKVISHSPNYIKNHPELWPDRKGHWKGNYYILDADKAVCGDLEEMDNGFSAYANGDNSRRHDFVLFMTKEAAKKRIEEDCR